MARLPAWLKARLNALRRARLDRETEEELAFHLESRTADLERRGLSAIDARRQARVEFGSVTHYTERIREARGWPRLEAAARDVDYGVRALRRSPGFALIAIVSLALGIGANSAVFSVIHAVLLRALPYPQPEQLVLVSDRGSNAAVTIQEYEFSKDHATSFASAAGYRGEGDGSLGLGVRHESISAMAVTTDFFRTLGIAPVLGREFNAEETRPDGPRAMVLSDGLWRRVFDADPQVVGHVVALEERPYTVTGVLPAGFWFPETVDAFVPLRPTGSLSDIGTNTQMIARLKGGVTQRDAEAEMATLSANMRRAYPDAMKGASRGLTVMSFRGWLVGDVQLNLLLVFGAVCVLLLISCANLASLLLARLTHRKQEIAMRLALGCSRGRLLQQFLLENMLLAAAGGLGGWLCARTLLVVLVALIPFRLTTVAPIRLDGLVLMFTVAVALATGLALSLVPILSTSRLALSDVLKAGGRSSGWASRQRMRTALVVSEVALSVTLLVTAGLLMQSLYRLRQERLGFNPQGLTTFTTPFGAEHRGNARDLWRYESTLLQRLQAIPGVRTVAAINVLPLTGFANLPTEQDGRPEHSNGAMEVRIITPAYFEALGIPLRLGRWFLASDTAASSSVILINETLARQWWVGGNPLGDRVVIGRFRGRDFGHPTPREVVGVVADTKTTYLNQPPRPTVYIPAAQMSDAPDHTAWVLRGSGSNDLAGNVRRAIAEIDSRQRVGDIQSMEAIVTSTTSNSRFDAWLFGLLAGLALVLVVVGVYGILSFSVARRTYEIGTRMALGASRAQVMRLVLDEGFRLIAIGLVAGLAGALIVTRFLTTLLFGVRPSDPSSFLAVSVLLLGVGVLASYFPARRATKVDPMVALRAE